VGFLKGEIMTEAMTPTDSVVAESRGGYFKSKLRMAQGRIELTSKSLIWYQSSIWWQMFGFLGALLSLKGKRTFDLDFTQIASLARGKYALNTKILDVTMADGAQHRFMINKYDAFTAELKNQLAKAGRPLEIASAAS
jgi:hypothetical protein